MKLVLNRKRRCGNFHLEENASDEALEKYADGFKELVKAIDPTQTPCWHR